MTPELEKKLVEKYPDILQDYGGNPKNTCMAWGIECNDGWYRILDELFDYLQGLIDNDYFPQIVADQIKEKYGTLRFYYSLEGQTTIEKTKEITHLVEFAEYRSSVTCELCGKEGKLETGSWWSTRCEECE